MCYESCELMYNTLTHIGFNVIRIPTVVLKGTTYHPDIPNTHNILIVEVDNKKFLIDIGFGYNSLRYPLECTLQKTEEI